MNYIKLNNEKIFNNTSLAFNTIDEQVRIGILDISELDAKEVFSEKENISEINILNSDNQIIDSINNYNKLLSIIIINIESKKLKYINSDGEENIAKTEAFIFLGKED